MNRISEDKFLAACDLYCEGASVREVMQKVGIARETAHRIQKEFLKGEFEDYGRVRIRYGNKKDGTPLFRFTSDPQPSWGWPVRQKWPPNDPTGYGPSTMPQSAKAIKRSISRIERQIQFLSLRKHELYRKMEELGIRIEQG